MTCGRCWPAARRWTWCWRTVSRPTVFVSETLIRFRYQTLLRADKGAIQRYLAKMTGKSPPQLQRLIGERRKPRPHERPSFLRVVTVHQGGQDGEKGLYHINLVDEVTQWEHVATVRATS